MSATSWRLKNVSTALKIYEVISFPRSQLFGFLRTSEGLRTENTGTYLDEIRMKERKCVLAAYIAKFRSKLILGLF